MWRKAMVGALLLLITSVFVAQPALAQSPVWHAQYYNNAALSGSPAFTREDANISFNWGSGSPGSGIGNDNFSVRWATDVALSPGTYRFYAQADDNIRIIFNFGYQPVIDTFASGQVNQLVTGDVTVQQAGTYHIQVDYRELTDAAFAYVSFANLASNPGGPSFATPIAPVPVGVGNWTAQYYSNTSLSGDPVAILTESRPSHNWGSGSPLASVPADNFSVRWISSQSLPGGTYNISVSVDDGVRVWVNGGLVIDQWHGASGQTYTATVTLPAGLSYFQVEYYELTAEAYINFSITQNGGGVIVAPTAVPPAGSSVATVTAYRLNVRSTPDGINGQIITRVNRLETYPVVGRTGDASWYLISVGGTNGWVSANFINVSNPGAVPVVGAGAQPTAVPGGATGNNVTADPYNVVIRSGPGTQFRRVGLLPVGGSAPVIGRTSVNSWWQISFNGITGWVSGQYAHIGAGANINAIPVTG
jgi:uncharacterized protein YraI